MDDDRSILKRGAKRTLWLRAVHGQQAEVVVKRFHAPGVFDRLRDPHRAESERRTLEALFALGLPVPEPLGTERHAAGVDLVMRSIEGARSLALLLRDPLLLHDQFLLRDPSASPRAARIARSVGELLARAAVFGLRHPDLHAGNVLVDGADRAWLVDLRGARLGGAFDWSEHERALVVLAADVRERTRGLDRARVLIASLRFLERAGCSDLPRARDVAQRIEHAARIRRRSVLARASRRWMRASSVTQPIERETHAGTEHGLRARGADESRCWQALDAPGARPFVAGSARDVTRAWRTAARLHEHGIPVAAPLAMVRGARARAVFGSLDDTGLTTTRALSLAEVEGDPALRAAASQSLGNLLGLLSDRGLRLADPVHSSVTFDARGKAAVAIGARVRSVDPLEPQTAGLPVFPLAARETHATEPVTSVARPEKLRRRIRARALDGLTHVAALVPPPLFRCALEAVSPLAAWTRFERITRSNLELALCDTTDARERARIARGVRRHCARQFAEWVRLAKGAAPDARAGRWIEDLVELDPSIALLERELARGRGALVVTAHIGNWELLAARIRRAGHRGAVVGFARPNDSSSRWFEAMRRGYGVETISQSASPRAILRALEAGAVVGLLSDLEVRRLDGEFLPFFGRTALTMTAPAALARAARAPLLPAKCVLEPLSGRYRLAFDLPLEPDRSLDRRASTTDVTARLNGAFERWIRAAPEQWAWHQPRWRTQPGSPLVPAAKRPWRTPAGPSLQSADQGLAVD